MGDVSENVFLAAVNLGERISNEYGCAPQGVVVDGGIGFNLGGREVGRIIDKPYGIQILFYRPGKERILPAFSDRFG